MRPYWSLSRACFPNIKLKLYVTIYRSGKLEPKARLVPVTPGAIAKACVRKS